MAIQPQEVAPDAVFTQTPPSPPTPQPDGKDRSTWNGWPSCNTAQPRVLMDNQGRLARIRTPVLDLEGHMTPTHLFYVVQHFAVPEPMRPEDWRVTIDGEIEQPVTLTYEELRRLPARTVRTVMECSGSDADFFEYFKGERSRPVRATEGMILSAGEFTGVPLATVLAQAGLNHRAAHVRVEGWDRGVPPSARPGTPPFYYDKGLPLEKALHPDTILAWAHNGELLEHLHGAPIRLLVPGWSGNWSVKWGPITAPMRWPVSLRKSPTSVPCPWPRRCIQIRCWPIVFPIEVWIGYTVPGPRLVPWVAPYTSQRGALYEMNGEPLPSLHGFPLRLLVPGWYGMTSIKWLVGIRVIDHVFKGFYQTDRYMVQNGPGAKEFYTYLTEMKVKSIITNPAPGEVVPPGRPYRVAGAAWSGEKEIVRVEVSTDGGTTWQEARLMPRIDYSWYRWEFLWQSPTVGDHTLMSRATNNKGETQPMEFPNRWDGHPYGNNMIFPHPVRVRAA